MATRANRPTKEHPEIIINNVFIGSSDLEALMRPGRKVRAPRLELLGGNIGLRLHIGSGLRQNTVLLSLHTHFLCTSCTNCLAIRSPRHFRLEYS